MRDLVGLILAIRVLDLIDIALVALIFYVLFRLLRQSRSRVALEGLLTVLVMSFFLYFFALFFDFSAMRLIFERFWIILVLAALIVFQNEFKKALTDLGQLRIVRALFKHRAIYIDEIVSAVQSMASRHTGALIAIERHNPLRMYADTGAPLDAVVGAELLRTIFTPHSPLHDGAVVVRNERVVAAACILPLSSDITLSSDLGTRHRAALGLSEETDALVVTVSEETGIVSLAVGAQLERNLSAEDLRHRLMAELDLAAEEAAEEEPES